MRSCGRGGGPDRRTWVLVHGIMVVGVCTGVTVLYILDGYIMDGQAIHHSDRRQVLNLDGGSAALGDELGLDDDGDDAGGLWLHGDRGRWAVSLSRCEDGVLGSLSVAGGRAGGLDQDLTGSCACCSLIAVYAACDSTTR